MDKIWGTIIRATGSVGVVAYLLYYLINQIFSEQIIRLFGSDKLFALTIIIIAALLIILLVAILKPKESPETSRQSKSPQVTYKGNSTHNGNNNF